MTKRTFLAAPLLALFTAGLHAAPADEAMTRLRGAVNEVLGIATKASSKSTLAASVTPVLRKHISFETMTRRAVGPGWNSFKPDEKAKATQLFSSLVVRTYANKFTPGEQPQVDYKAATSPAAGRVDVPTTLLYQGSRYSVTYRMEQAGGWLITDVVIEGVSMIANYRSQLDSVFKKGGAPAVLTSLQQSVSKQS